MVLLSPRVCGWASIVESALTPPVHSLMTIYNLYTLLAGKQVLAAAGLAGVQIEAPDVGVSASTTAFPKII